MKVCFVCWGAYSLFRPDRGLQIGGMETRSWLFARALANDKRYEVHFVVEKSTPEIEQYGAITVWPHPGRWRALSRGLLRRWRVPGSAAENGKVTAPTVSGAAMARSRRGWRARLEQWRAARAPVQPHPNPLFRSIGADAFLAFGVNALSAETIASCRRYGGTSILLLAANVDLSEEYRAASRAVNAYSAMAGTCYYAIKSADLIVAQTEDQSRVLKDRFGRQATIIRNPIDLQDAGNPRSGSRARDAYVLWIGRADPLYKRPGLCLAVAERCPEIPFLAVVNPSDRLEFQRLRAACPPNVRLVEYVPHDELGPLFGSAAILLNTSSSEGFPNTFLQAAKFGVPVASLDVDPDGILSRRGLGLVAGGSLDTLARQVRELWSDEDRAQSIARGMEEYVRSRHSIEGRAAELAALLEREVGAKRDHRRYS